MSFHFCFFRCHLQFLTKNVIENLLHFKMYIFISIWSTYSTVLYIEIHPSLTTLHPPKYRIYSMRRPTKKKRDKMNDFIYKTGFYLQDFVCWEWEKNTQNEKFSVWLPSLLRYRGRLFSGDPKLEEDLRKKKKRSRTW